MSEWSNRRSKLLDLMEDNSLAIIYAGVSKICSEDEFYPFFANRNFFYLTNIEQENSILLLVKSYGERKAYLFMDEHNELKERWTGRRLTFEEASKLSDMDNVLSTNNFASMLESALDPEEATYGKINNIYMDLSPELKIGDNLSTKMFADDLQAKYPNVEIKNVYPHLVSMRVVKSQFEVESIVEATNITNLGINDLLINLHPGMHEHELSDRFEYYGKTHGRRTLAFSTICAAGKDATIMHHPVEQQDRIIDMNDLVLFDLGYNYNGYSADISRTYPVNGIFEGKQKLIYEAVLNCNKAVINMIKPGLKLKDLQGFTLEFLKKETVRLGLLKEEDDIKKYYIHNVSHHLGLDTHDVCDREMPLTPGCVITVEPGLYFVEDGIGVRIEDDVLVTDKGSDCLSKGIKKEIADIEKMLRNKKGA